MKKKLAYIRNHYAEIYKVFLFVVSIIIIVTVLPKELQFKYEYNLNMPWMYEDLVAPEDFPIIKTESEIKKEKEQLRKQVKPYFVYNEDLTKQTLAEAEISFDSAWVQQFGFEDKKQYELNRNFYLNTLKEILHQGVINIPNAFRLKDDQVITLIRNNTGHEGFVKDYYTVSSAFEEIKKRTNRDENLQASFLKPLFLRAIVQNINYDKNKTENELSTILDNLSPYRGMVQKGQRIIDKGEIISPDVYRILQSLQKDFESKTRQSSITVTIGESILIAIPMIAFFLYLFFFRNDIYEDSKNLLMLLILIITMVVLTRILVTYHSSYVFIVPLMISPIVIRAFYDTQLALITHIITVILVSFIVPSSFQFLFFTTYDWTYYDNQYPHIAKTFTIFDYLHHYLRILLCYLLRNDIGDGRWCRRNQRLYYFVFCHKCSLNFLFVSSYFSFRKTIYVGYGYVVTRIFRHQ
jgi:membrane-associated HD superfamily phosphohydrolase